jgi:hypothetical protein
VGYIILRYIGIYGDILEYMEIYIEYWDIYYWDIIGIYWHIYIIYIYILGYMGIYSDIWIYIFFYLYIGIYMIGISIHLLGFVMPPNK